MRASIVDIHLGWNCLEAKIDHMPNSELFDLYDSNLVLRLHNAKNLSDTRKILAKFKGLGGRCELVL